MEKICFIINSLQNAGPVTVLYEIIRGLDNNRFSPFIVVLKKEIPQNTRLSDFEKIGCKIKQFGFSFIDLEIKTRKCAQNVSEYLIEQSITVTHLHGYHPVIISKYFDNSIKTIVTFHNICGVDFVKSKGLLIGKYMVLRYLKSAKKIKYLVGISHYTSDYYEKKLKRNVITIPNGVDFSKFIKCSEKEKERLRQEYKIPIGKKIYTIIGVGKKVKNIPFILNCIKKTKLIDTLFLFIGTGPMIEKYKCIAQNLDNCLFLGRRNDVEKILQMSDFYISASKSEGFGLSAVEALITGNTILYSDIPTYREIFYSIPELREFMFSLKDISKLCSLLMSGKKIDNYNYIRNMFYNKYSNAIMSKQYQELY